MDIEKDINGEYIITEEFLLNNPNYIFVFGDNILRVGKGGAAKFRSFENTYGFITKKYPSVHEDAYYKPGEYVSVYNSEIYNLTKELVKNYDKTYLISKLGAGLANKNRIFENVIEPNIKKDLKHYKNVFFLW